MGLVTIDANKLVFEIDSFGDNFYFIIDGEVEVRIPDFENIREYKKVCNKISYLEDQLVLG
jgi:hypothetical protein